MSVEQAKRHLVAVMPSDDDGSVGSMHLFQPKVPDRVAEQWCGVIEDFAMVNLA